MPPSILPATSPPRRPMDLLPECFAPDVTHVIIGRGKKHSKHPGNLRYSTLIHEEMHAYAAAQNKAGKSEVISNLVTRIRETGNFVREAGQSRYSLVEEHTVRTTTAQHFRDALFSKYRSSKEMKKQKRKKDRSVDEEPLHKRSRCVSPKCSESSEVEEETDSKPGCLSKQLQAKGHLDTLSIFSNAVFMNKINFRDSDPFEPTPLRHSAASIVFETSAGTVFPLAPMSSSRTFDAFIDLPFFHEVHETSTAKGFVF
jgi:hypothetical protein